MYIEFVRGYYPKVQGLDFTCFFSDRYISITRGKGSIISYKNAALSDKLLIIKFELVYKKYTTYTKKTIVVDSYGT